MDLDADWWSTDMADDVFDMLRTREVQLGVPKLKNQPLTKPERRSAVEWLIRVSTNKDTVIRTAEDGFSKRTLHLAVHIFDYYIVTKDPSTPAYYVVAAASLIIAAKFEELHVRIPSLELWIQSLQAETCIKFTRSLLRQAEKYILLAIDFRLTAPTVVCFVPYFVAVSEDAYSHPVQSLKNSGKPCHLNANDRIGILRQATPTTVFVSPSNHALRHLGSFTANTPSPEPDRRGGTPRLQQQDFESFVYFLCTFSLKDSAYMEHKSSEIAVAAVAAARFCLNVTPAWIESFELLIGVGLASISRCIHSLLHDFDCERRRNPACYLPLMFACTDFASSWQSVVTPPPTITPFKFDQSLSSSWSAPCPALSPPTDIRIQLLNGQAGDDCIILPTSSSSVTSSEPAMLLWPSSNVRIPPGLFPTILMQPQAPPVIIWQPVQCTVGGNFNAGQTYLLIPAGDQQPTQPSRKQRMNNARLNESVEIIQPAAKRQKITK